MIKKITAKLAAISLITVFSLFFMNWQNAFALNLRWQNMPIKVCIPQNNYAPVMKKAFLNWQSASNNKVSFSFTCQNPQITVTYAPKKQKSLTTYSFYSNGIIYKAHIEMGLLTKEGNPASEKVLLPLMMHEIGHAIGLQGHRSTPKSIMQPTVQSDYTITPDVIRDINNLYK